jgi:uncharacterized protein YtpQ (UPF0354 family)
MNFESFQSNNYVFQEKPKIGDIVLIAIKPYVGKYEKGKIKAMEEFIRYVKQISHNLQRKAFMKNKISNYFTPFIGFSDDDEKNVESMKNHFKDKEEDILQTYLTSEGIKRKY